MIRGCPKAYHPACIKRDEAFFQSKAKWNCGTLARSEFQVFVVSWLWFSQSFKYILNVH